MHLPDAAKMRLNPQGEWNNSRIVYDNGHVEHWLNGEKILEFDTYTDEWFALKNSGKWADAPEYGLARRGVISVSYTHLDVYKRQIRSSTPIPH